MMKKMQKSVLALMVLGATTLPAMAAGVDVKVTGTILPAGCTPTLSGGGTVDYGNISVDNLSKTDYTALSANQIDFSIKCSAPIKVAVKAIDGRPNTAAGAKAYGIGGVGISPVNLLGGPDMFVSGLGTEGGTLIGGYAIQILPSSVTADEKRVDGIKSADMGVSWTGGASGELYDLYASRYYSWAAAGTMIPVAFETLNGKLQVQAYLNKASELDLSKPVKLDGLTTIELVYL